MKTVLVVEGNGQDREALQTLLRDHGYTVTEADGEGWQVGDAGGRPVEPEGFVEDITERRGAERQLRFTQFAIDKAVTQAFWVDEQGRFLYVNEAACSTLGYSRDELMDITICDIDPDCSPELFAQKWQELKRQCSKTFERRHQAKDGGVYPVEIRANYLVFDGQEYLCLFATDISERKASEEDLRQASLIVENSPVVLFRWRAAEGWPVEMVSRNVSQLGYTPEELLSGDVPFTSLVYPEDLGRVVAELEKQVRCGGDRFKMVYRIVTKRGEVRWVDERTQIERNAEGRVTHYQGLVMDVSERKAAEEALRQTSVVVENSPAVLFRWGAAEGWPVEMVSRNVSQFGYSAEELVAGNVPYATLMSPQDVARIAAELQDYFCRGEDRYRLEYRIVTKQGDVRWIDSRTVVERDAEGRTSHYQGIILDISDRKRAEQALRDSERRYRSIIEHAPFGITRSSKDGKLLSANPALASILKYDSAAELMETVNGSSIQDALFPEPSDRGPLVEHILSNDSWTIFNNRLRCKDGSIVTCRVHSRRMVEENGQAGEFESYQENITDQLAAEEALRESEEKFRVLAETSPVAICIYQGERIIYANPAMERLLGCSADELYRMKFWEWAGGDSRDMVRKHGLARLRGEEVPAQYECAYVTAAGEERVILVSAGMIEYQGQPTGIASFFDITERKRSEELIKRSLAEKEVLLREIHHRVKNNLQAVSSLLYLQAQKLPDPELQKHFLESQNRICSMALAHEQLYQSKSLADVRVGAYVASLLGQLLQVLQPDQQQIDCRTEIEDIVLDIEKVIPCGLLITELMTNAFKHAFPAGRNGTVTIAMRQQEGQLVLSVADDGVGLPGDLDWRRSNTLGLQLVTALVNQLNGTLEVEGEGGTLFRVIFAA